MKIQHKDSTTFGILKGYRKTSYGEYTWGIYRGHKIEVYDASKSKQKLIYVSDNKLMKWIKSKLTYWINGVKKINKSEAR